jgi:hypothetical protein
MRVWVFYRVELELAGAGAGMERHYPTGFYPLPSLNRLTEELPVEVEVAARRMPQYCLKVRLSDRGLFLMGGRPTRMGAKFGYEVFAPSRISFEVEKVSVRITQLKVSET